MNMWLSALEAGGYEHPAELHGVQVTDFVDCYVCGGDLYGVITAQLTPVEDRDRRES